MLRFLAVVRPQKAEALCQALLAWGGVESLEVAEVLGGGTHFEAGRPSDSLDVLPKVRVGGLIADDARETLIEHILATARSGRIGDGKLFLMPVAGQIDAGL